MISEKRKHQILIVEDNEGDFVLAQEALKQIGSDSELIHFYSADEALEYLFNTKGIDPDLILLDLNLPGMDGLELLKIIKNDDSKKNISVIIFSTSESESDKERSLKLNADLYITKPLDLSEFFNTFRKIDDFIKNNKKQV